MKLQFLFIIFFLSLLNFKGLLNSNIITYIIAFIQIIIYISFSASKKLLLFSYLNKRVKYLLLTFIFIYLLSILRSKEYSILILLEYIGFCLFSLSYISAILSKIKEKEIDLNNAFFTYYILPFVLYCFTNLLFWMLNIKSPSDGETIIGQSMILASYGVYMNRVNFIFAEGINSFAVVIGAIFTFTLSYTLILKQYNLINIITNFALLIALLLTDSRSSIFYPLLIAILSFIVYKSKKYKIIKITPFLFILAPFLFISLLPLISEIEFFQKYSRSATDLFTMNGRLYIWFFALEDFLQFDFNQLLGYGYMGHVSSGASLKWSFMFISYPNPETVHPHNSIISLLFDIGYIGLFIILLVFVQISKSLTRLWNSNQQLCMTLFSLLIYIIFISISESFICLYYLNSLNIFISFVVFLFSIDAYYQFQKTE